MKPWANTSKQARDKLRPIVESGQAICGKCGHMIMPGQAWDIGHIIAQDIAPYLTHEQSNWRVEHRGCNRSAGAIYGNRKRGHAPRPLQKLPTPSRKW